MALAQYSDRFWFPSGVLATAVAARVFPVGSNSLAQLWADAAGTIALPNPLNTDGLGFLTFYATVGEYWVHLDSESFLIDVGLSQEQADLSTGLASGGDLDIAGPTSVTIGPLVGYIVDNSSLDPVAPTVARIDFPGATIPLDAASLLRTITYWKMDAAQNVIQQGTPPTPEDFRRYLVLAGSIYDTMAGQIIEVQGLPTILPQQANQLVDLMNALGPFSLSGNVVTPNGANLSVNKSAGTLFARAFNFIVAPNVITDSPHISASPAQTPATLRRILSTAQTPTPPPVTTIDPANYDVGGVLTPVGGGSGSATIQRVWLFATNTSSAQIAVQYGQSVYASLNVAQAAIGAGTSFNVAPVATLGTLIGYIAVTRTATNLSDPAQATFVKAGKFATP